MAARQHIGVAKQIIEDYTSSHINAMMSLLRSNGKSPNEISELIKSTKCRRYMMAANKKLVDFISQG